MGLWEAMKEQFLGRLIRLDAGGKALSISDDLLVGGLNRLAAAKAPELQVSVEGTADDLFVRAVLGGRKVAVHLALDRVIYANGQVLLQIRTPQGVEFEDQPLVTGMARLITVFLGAKMAEVAFAAAGLPEGVAWNGKDLTVTRELSVQLARRPN